MIFAKQHGEARLAADGIADDLNAPNALAGLFTFIHRANAELDRRGSDTDALERARATFARINGVLDIVPDRTVDDPELEWKATSGWFSAGHVANTRYLCDAVGPQTLKLSATDSTGCERHVKLEVTCLEE